MYLNLLKLVSSIENDENLNDNQKKAGKYVLENAFKKIQFINENDFDNLKLLLEELDYDVDSFHHVINFAYYIKNSINYKEGNPKLRPNMKYVYKAYSMAKDLNFDLHSHDVKYKKIENVTFTRILYRLLQNNDILNNEVSIIDLANTICEKHYQGKNRNDSLYVILKTLDMVERGVKDLPNKNKVIFLSEDIEALFTMSHNPYTLPLTDIIKEFYPFFSNNIFGFIKMFADNVEQEDFNTNNVMNYLHSKEEAFKNMDGTKKKILSSIKKIELDMEKSTSDIFISLMEDIKNNKYLDNNVRQKILNNIKATFKKYTKNQDDFLKEELDVFFKNCVYYINDLIIPSKDKRINIDELIVTCLSKCKDLFLTHDGRKFKEIIDYIISNTQLKAEDLIPVAGKCSNLFKDANIDKLKTIQLELRKFKDFVNKNRTNEIINEDIFENILLKKPELLLKNNELGKVISFLKGEKSLNDYGYKGETFKLNDGIYTFEFLKNLALEDYETLFDTNIEKIINNLNYIEGLCSTYNINFRKLKINEDMIMMLLKEDFKSLDDSFRFFGEFMSNNDLKLLVEANPRLFLINEKHLSLILTRCLSNESNDYPFAKLLASELYTYRKEDYDKDDEEILDKPFKYYDIGTSGNIDIEGVFVNDILKSFKCEDVYETYCERRKKIEIMEEILKDVSSNYEAIEKLNDKISKVLNLYKEVYTKVPNSTFLEKLRDAMGNKIEEYRYRISDTSEQINANQNLLNIFVNERSDSYLTRNTLNELLEQLSSDVIKEDVMAFLKQIETKRIKESESQIDKYSKIIDDLNERVKVLSAEEDQLSYNLNYSESNNLLEDISNDYHKKKIFTIEELNKKVKKEEKNPQVLIEEALDGNNLIIFADSVDLDDIPYDKHYIEKTYKFLIGDKSISSYDYMKNNSKNTKQVKKLSNNRDGIWERREDGTKVRIYFIPIKSKYFSCYFITGVNYKDASHKDAGCQDDTVYYNLLKQANRLEEKIAKMTDEEILEFIKKSKAVYDKKVEYIVKSKNSFTKNKNQG